VKLTVERNASALSSPVLKVGNTTVLVTPAIGEDFWLLRVKVSETQALVLFPKFGVYGIGFALETDWNTNLPSTLPAERIYAHIAHNKGDKAIPKKRCLQAIEMLQAALAELKGG
jgi:hypothetical protein